MVKYMAKKERLIRRSEVEHRTGLSRAAIYRVIAEDSFPKPIQLGKRMVAWVESEIDDWIQNQISSRKRR